MDVYGRRPTKQARSRLGVTEAACLQESGGVYLVTLYVRSPAAFLEDSMLWPPLLPRMLTNPRTVCFCHPVACIISVSVAPLARLIIAMTSAFLLLRSEAFSPVGLPDAFFAALTFLARFPALRGAS